MSGPDVWGPHGWKFIHFITLGYPNNPSSKDKKNYKNFFKNMKNMIPCSICANHYEEHLKIYPLDDSVLSNKKNFINWGIQMHNSVNKMHSKKIYGYKDGLKEIIKNSDPIYVKEEQSLSCKPCKNNTTNNIIIYSILLSVIGYFIYNNYIKKK
jgi:hypothetical protein